MTETTHLRAAAPRLSLHDAGVLLFATALAGLGLVELVSGEALPGLHLLPDAPEAAARVAGAILFAAATLLIAGPFRRHAGFALAIYWSLFAAASLAVAVVAAVNPTAWVSAAETAVFAAAAASLTAGSGRHDAAVLLLRLLFGAMLILFGVVHLLYRDAIAGMIPDWIPFAAHWPWLTGAINVFAGLACVSGIAVRPAAFAIAAMFGAWLPLVHAPRLIAAPSSVFEWSFALTAVALTGVALMVAGGIRRRAA